MAYSRKFEVFTHDVDMKDEIRPAALLRFFQEAAVEHMGSRGVSADELFSRGLAYMVSRFTLRFAGRIGHGDVIDVNTWPCPGGATVFNRAFSVTKNGSTAAEALSSWVLVDLASRKIMRRHGADAISSENADAPDLSLRFHPPEEGFVPVGEEKISYCHIDRNGHVNNANYADMLIDFLPDAGKRHIREMNIYFAAESLLGEKLEVMRADDGDAFYFRMVSGGRVRIEARFDTYMND